MRALLLSMAILLAGCSAPPGPAGAAAVTFRPGQSAETTLAAGRYRVTWDAGGCTGWTASIGQVLIPIVGTAGSVEIDLPAGQTFINSSAACPSGAEWTLTVAPV